MSENMALWHHGGGIRMEAWAIVPGRMFRSRKSYYLQMLAAHGDQIDILLTDIREHNDDIARLQLSQRTQNVEILGDCWPRSDELFKATALYHHEWFSLYRIVGEVEIPVHDIDNVIVLQSRGSCARTYMIPASCDFSMLGSGNAFYYLGKQYSNNGSYNVLYKKCLDSKELTLVKRLPEEWKLSDEWFIPTLKY
uniref:Uncharacterized protein n=1 Tax=Oryza brachyantha TaxID=4533 RepID=J3L0M5_ORYBR